MARDLRWADMDDLVANYLALYDEREKGLPIGITLFETPPAMADEIGWFTSLYARVTEGRGIAVVGEMDGKAVALCTVDIKGSRPRSELSHVGVLGILINSAYRGRGLGKLLMKEAIRRCRGKFEIIELSVFANNDVARRLYAGLGFQTVGRIPRGLKRGSQFIDEEIMVLPLTGPGAAASS